MPSNEDRSRREILQTGAQITAGGILTGLAGCQDSEGTGEQAPEDGNSPENKSEDKDTDNDTKEISDVTYEELAQIAVIDLEGHDKVSSS